MKLYLIYKQLEQELYTERIVDEEQKAISFCKDNPEYSYAMLASDEGTSRNFTIKCE